MALSSQAKLLFSFVDRCAGAAGGSLEQQLLVIVWLLNIHSGTTELSVAGVSTGLGEDEVAAKLLNHISTRQFVGAIETQEIGIIGKAAPADLELPDEISKQDEALPAAVGLSLYLLDSWPALAIWC